MSKQELSVEQPLPEIFRDGDKLNVPQAIEIGRAIEALQGKLDYDEEPVAIEERIDGFWWDAAYSFYRAMCEHYDWVMQKPISRGWFGKQLPQLTAIEVGIENGKKTFMKVPTGRFTLPKVDGHVETGMAQDAVTKRAYFVLNGEVRRKHEYIVRKIAARARELIAQSSIYKSKALRIRFTDNDGDVITTPQPEFVDVSNVTRESLILNDDIKAMVETSVFAPILYTNSVRKIGIPLKRGVLLAGPYGTGKTLTATMTAHVAQNNGWTFLYCSDTSDLLHAVEFARYYTPCVIFCEDIDRTMAGERTNNVNNVLNVIDGMDTKDAEIMFVLTTNHPENIVKAFMRPGRIDVMIPFEVPDATTAGMLVAHYAGNLLAHDVDLTSIGEVLQGHIPAMIRECVERAKLANIYLHQGSVTHKITQEALLTAAKGMQAQMRLIEGQKPAEQTPEQIVLAAVGDFINKHASNPAEMRALVRMIQELYRKVV